MTRPGSLALAVGLLAALGCHRTVRPPAPREAVASASQAIAVVARREAETTTMTVTFQLTVQRPGGSEEGSRGAVVVARPDRLRLQIFSFGVMTAYDYTVNGDRYRVRRPLDRVETIGRFGDAGDDEAGAFGVDLRPLFLPTATAESASARDAGDHFVVVVAEERGRREIDVSKRDGAITREALYRGADLRVVIEYGDYRTVDGAALPFVVEVTYPEKGVRLTIRVAHCTRNQPVDPRLFEF
jgi:outer membrane lipoprotein-sorting protein